MELPIHSSKSLKENQNNEELHGVSIGEFAGIGILNASLSSLKKSQRSLQIIDKLENDQDEDFIDESKQQVRYQEQDSFTIRLNKRLRPFYGYILATIAAFSFCLSNVIIKMLFTLSGADYSFISYVVWFITLLVIVKYKKLSLCGPPKQRKLLNLRGFIGFFGLITITTAVKYISPSDIISLGHSSLIITAIFGRIFLKEKLCLAHFVASIFTICGIIFICKPKLIFSQFISMNNTLTNNTSEAEIPSDGYSSTMIGVTLVLLGAFAIAIIQITIRKLCIYKIHYSISSIYATYYGLPMSFCLSILLYLLGETHQNLEQEYNYLLQHIFYSIFAALLGIIGLITFNLSLKYEDATKIAIIKTSDVFFSFILQYLILDIKVDILNFIGALLIFTGILFIISFKLIQDYYEGFKNFPQEKCVYC